MSLWYNANQLFVIAAHTNEPDEEIVKHYASVSKKAILAQFSWSLTCWTLSLTSSTGSMNVQVSTAHRTTESNTLQDTPYQR